MELSTRREAISCAATPELHRILWNPKVQHYIQKSHPLVYILSQTNPVHTTNHPISPSPISILSTHLRLGLPSGLLPSGFPTNNLYAFQFPPYSFFMPRPSHPAIQSIPNNHPTSSSPILILSTHLRLGLPSGLLPSGFPTNNLYAFQFSPYSFFIPRPSHPAIQSIPNNHPTSSSPILILSTHLCLGLPSGLLSSGFPTNNLYAFQFSPYSFFMPRPSHPA
jgi:hypothetical protein